MTKRGDRSWTPALGLLAALLAVGGCSGGAATGEAVDVRCGEPTKEAVVSRYVDALNANDREAVRRLVDGYGLDLSRSVREGLDDAVDERMTSFGGQGIRLTAQSFAETVPYVSTADLAGEADRGAYTERLPMRRPDTRPNWCLSLNGTPSVSSPPLPTAGTGR